jgi:2-hydroxy-6-oxonona-2,4-dienedioate hydrolase
VKATFCEINGIATRYLWEQHGDDRSPLLLLHGIGLSADSWCRNVDELSDGRIVVAADMLGHGFTDPVDLAGEPPYAATARHLIALTERLGWERFSIVGSSFGASIAATICLDRPDLIDKLVFVGTASALSTGEELRRILSGSRANGTAAMRAASVDACRTRLGNICFDGSTVPQELLLVQITSYAMPGRLEYYERAIEGMLSERAGEVHRVPASLEDIKAPTLIVWGKEDIRGSFARHEEALRRIPHARLLVLEECGHLPYLERPAAFNQAARDFLDARQ